jgi:hypothetical protein
MLQLEDNFDWPNPHYLNFVSTNDFMCQEFLHQSTIKKLVAQGVELFIWHFSEGVLFSGPTLPAQPAS